VYDNTSGKLVRHFHRKNIIGNRLEWLDPITYSFALRGDFVAFSKIMDSEMYEVIVKRLHDWAHEVCRDLSHVEIEGGDSILMIDPSPQKVIGAAKELVRRALSFRELPMRMRFGGAAGPIRYGRGRRLHNGNWERILVPIGLALRTSARLEPHAAPCSVLVEELFYEFGGGRDPLHHEVAVDGETHVEGSPGDLMIPLSREDVPGLKYNESDQKFVVQKNALDPPNFTRLYQIKLTN
jgi:class 3 adenylate cyclase